MHASTRALLERAQTTARRLHDAGQTARGNRFSGRAEVVIARHCARLGEPLPTLYVHHEWDGSYTARTWMGNRVAPLEITGKAPAFHCTLTCFAAVIEGRRYYGRGHGSAMYLNLRPGRVVK